MNQNILKSSDLALLYTADGYCAPVWLRNKYIHYVDTRLMRLLLGTTQTAPLAWDHVLTNIASLKLGRQEALRES